MGEAGRAELLRRYFPVWERLTRDERDALLENSAIVRYGKGERIHGGDGDCVGVVMIKSGELRTYMLSEEGREITLYRLGPGDICVLSASCVLASITFDVHIDAEEDSEVLLIGMPYFSELVSRNIYAECFSYKLAGERFSDVMWAMQQILFMSMDRRLAIFLWDELAKTEDDTIRLTHEQIARYVGSAREVVTRMLNYFASEGLVELRRGGIRVRDRKKLRALAQ